MKFITEDDLRCLYKLEAFTSYDLQQGERLTPGARQFLIDRGIHMFDETIKGESVGGEQGKLSTIKKGHWKVKKLQRKIHSLEAMFLLTAEELLKCDVILSQKILALTKLFSFMKDAATVENGIIVGKELTEGSACQDCTGMEWKDFHQTMEDCFPITEFHLSLEKGREILSLHKLRCEMRELEPMVLELLEGACESKDGLELIMERANVMINSLSQIICLAVGGKTCQRIK